MKNRLSIQKLAAGYPVSIFLCFSILFGAFYQAKAVANYSPIPTSQLDQYKKAVEIAVGDAHKWNCKETLGDIGTGYLEYISNAKSGYIETSGAQPILVFEFVNSKEPRAKYISSVTTSKDYNSIVQFKFEKQELKPTNTGDLRHPRLSEGYVIVASAECKPRDQ